MLTQEEKSFYNENGYLLHKKQLFDADDLVQLESIMEEHLSGRGKKRSDELDTPHFGDERLFYYLMAPEVLDLVEDIIGPNIGLWSSHFICKEPLHGRRTPGMKTALTGRTGLIAWIILSRFGWRWTKLLQKMVAWALFLVHIEMDFQNILTLKQDQQPSPRK